MATTSNINKTPRPGKRMARQAKRQPRGRMGKVFAKPNPNIKNIRLNKVKRTVFMYRPKPAKV